MRFLMIIMMLFFCIHPVYAETPSTDFPITRVGEGIYVHHGAHLDIDDGYHGDICNISFIVGSKGVAVIDTGGSLKIGQQLRTALRKITPLPVLYVINTHVHPDHIYGNAAFLADHPEFVGHEKLATYMELRREQYAKLNARLLGKDAEGSLLIKPSIAVKQTLTLDLGDRMLHLTAHPVAHTHTDVSILDSKTNTLFTGDLLFTERTPVLEGDIKGLLTEIEKIKQIPAQQVVPGHGTTTSNWITAFDHASRYLNTLLSDVRVGIKKGETMEQVMHTAAASEREHWLLFDNVNRRNINTIYPILEWE